MRKFFRQLSLPRKLALIALIPLVFLGYVAFQLYTEKTDRVRLLKLYSQRIYQSANLSRLTDALQNERKLSFDFSIQKELGQGLLQQRKKTDSLIDALKTNNDLSLHRLDEYTFINGLPGIRKAIDQNRATPGQVMDTYTTMIFRLNTLNTSFPASGIYLRPITRDLAAQRLLTEMLTYLGIIRSNFFNVLYSREYIQETLAGTVGSYRVYRSYETEFRIKAPPEIIGMYEQARSSEGLKQTVAYIDTVFRRFSFDGTYNADEWWHLSNQGIDSLRLLQQKLWLNTTRKLDQVMQEEFRARNQTIVFLVMALLAVAAIVSYILHIITSMLRELKDAAGRIARGDAEVPIDIRSKDAIGSLAESVKQMEKQVRERTTALQDSNLKLQQSNDELEQFAYVASHDLQEPIRKIRMFADQLMAKNHDQLDEGGRRYLDKIISSADRMKVIILDLLRLSQLNRDEKRIERVDLNQVMANVQTDLELMISQTNAEIRVQSLPVIDAIPVQMNQLFYNLVNNALKFSKPGIPPVVEVTAASPDPALLRKIPSRQRGGYIQISVTDNGIGFSQEFSEKVFEMFQRLGTERSGTGIGLALCKKIVENHHGSIEVHSRPGEGTRFDILLPKSQAPAKA